MNTTKKRPDSAPEMKRVCLVAMPWFGYNRPQAALGVLKAFLQQSTQFCTIECVYAYLALWKKIPQLYAWLSENSEVGELMYLPHLYPDRIKNAKAEFIKITSKKNCPKRMTNDPEKVFGRIYSVTEKHLQLCVNQLVNRYDLIGISATCAQLFSSLALARNIKQKDSNVQIIMGGRIASIMGDAITKNFPFVDKVVVGEGEGPITHLVKSICSQKYHAIKTSKKTRLLLDNLPVQSLDQLPTPDYSEYFVLADKMGIHESWIPLEASRGCWWNRCHFCGLNSQKSYRAKSVSKIINEIEALTTAYENPRIFFVDTIQLQKGLFKLSQEVQAKNLGIAFVLEIRCNIRPEMLVQLKRMGCVLVQPGIEGLSTSYLKRINKGTTTIQNLQLMKICHEIGLQYAANLITDFPGSTEAEVLETVTNISDFAISYPPLKPNRFRLEKESIANRNRNKFGIQRVENSQIFLETLSSRINQQIELPYLQYKPDRSQANWEPVRIACATWKKTYFSMPIEGKIKCLVNKLYYIDQGTFLEIHDNRNTSQHVIILDKLWREVYLYCMRIRSSTQIGTYFAANPNVSELYSNIIPALVKTKLMFQEKAHYLSLAVAHSQELAIKRIESGC